MSIFVQKLIEDTKSGELDSIWKCLDYQKYVWSLPKHPFNGMKIMGGAKQISRTKTEPMGIIEMPNGENIDEIDFQTFLKLDIEIIFALRRWNEQIISDYLQSGLAQPEEEQNQNEENAQEEEDGTTEEN